MPKSYSVDLRERVLQYLEKTKIEKPQYDYKKIDDQKLIDYILILRVR